MNQLTVFALTFEAFVTANNWRDAAQPSIMMQDLPLNHRILQLVDIGNALCIQESLAKVDRAAPGGLDGIFFEASSGECLTGVNNCNFSGSTYAQAAQAICDGAGGTIITENVYICKEDLNLDKDVILRNVPLCLASNCTSDTTYSSLMQTILDIAKLGDQGTDVQFEGTYSGKCRHIEVEWNIPLEPYADQMAEVGETVTFFFDGLHNVFIYPSGSCSEREKIVVGEGPGPISYTFTDNDIGDDVTFACDIGGHCEAGQIITFSVLDPTTSPTLSPTVSKSPSALPTTMPSDEPTSAPTESLSPSAVPTVTSVSAPTESLSPSAVPTVTSVIILPDRKIPKPTNKDALKLKRSTIPNLPGIRGRMLHLSNGAPLEREGN